MKPMDTITDVLRDLQARGYVHDYNLHPDRLTCDEVDLTLGPDEFEISEVYRFEGPSDPADEAVVYAIHAKDGHDGILIDGYGPTSDSLSSEMVAKLVVHDRELN